MKVKFENNKDSLLKNLEKLEELKVRWGVRGERNAKVMVWNEFGTKYIPERPVFRITFSDKNTHKSIERKAGFAITQVMNGKDPATAMKAVGEAGLGSLRKTFTSDIPPANAESTVKRKGAGKNTLYDSGELFRGTGYEVISGK